ncbi:hypothetical protein COE15_18025 [Bacillus cereus]|uniref:DEAD/DEAH box helicase n=1 Tax=Bacillus sp. AFS023182 TaxID=2033492 RepID=UPI000BF36E83|nr:DEAD/DEAH box helicase [Bacillus sp. AFS023182]PFD96104.1 hypothetical protein CN288_24655 [Bacillus sp. AFS023182]PGX97303.1 hypothetical protein COE15_18025 [Bacillus cereus]
MKGLKKILPFFFQNKRKDTDKENTNYKETATKTLNYFIELEHFNFMNCDKESITLHSFKSFFHKEPNIHIPDFVNPNGTPHQDMQIFLQKKGNSAKGKYLADNNASLFYLPVAKNEVLRHFSNESKQKTSFTDFQKDPNSFLIHIQLNQMLKLIPDTPLESSVVVSPIVKYFLRTGKSLKELESDLFNTISSVIESDNYGKKDKTLEFIGSKEQDSLEKDINYIHIRFKNWEELTKNIQSTLQSYISKRHFDKDGVFRFCSEKEYEKYVRLTYKEHVGVNSFYINDLEKVKYEIKDSSVGKALETYLSLSNWEVLKNSGERVDLFKNESISEMKNVLRKIPITRWPSEFPLGLMQQVALNLIIAKSKEENGFIFSVNGPPGTGKTTLLKDVFANIIFEKVKFLKEATDLFSKVQFAEGQEDYYYSFHPKLKEYRILVTSNNNSAVENISVDLPKDKDLLKNGYQFLGFDKEKKCWGKISAAMGKTANIKEYFTTITEDLQRVGDLEHENVYSFTQLEQNVLKKIATAEENDVCHNVNEKKWQTSEEQFVNIDGENKDEQMNCERSKLFAKLMSEYNDFLIANQDKIEKNLSLAKTYFLGGKEKGNLDSQINEAKRDNFIQAMFDTVFLLTPILSSTFASIARFLKDLKTEDIGWLFIDEAGQATPQSAIGAIWRSRNVVVVGDPLQIPPVVTLSDDQLKLIANDSAGINEQYNFFYRLTRNEVSVQEFADLNNRYGGEMIDSNQNKTWLGSPLRVHRRCKNPMFSICNETTYQGKMFYGLTDTKSKESKPQYVSQWLDIGGKTYGTGNHFIPEQGEKAIEIAKKFSQDNPDKSCYIISPFVSVVQKLKQLKQQKLPGKEYGNIEIGTVHTFQGKEAPMVIFVLGVDDQKQGPLKWASSTPNLLNVAASRAKEVFVVIGNAESWGKQEYFDIAYRYLTKELVELK